MAVLKGSDGAPSKGELKIVSERKISGRISVARIAALYGDRATAEVLPGMGHWLIGEPGWEKLASRAVEWLEQMLPQNLHGRP